MLLAYFSKFKSKNMQEQTIYYTMGTTCTIFIEKFQFKRSFFMKNEQDQSSQITSEMRHFPSKNMKLPYRQCLNHQRHGLKPV